MVGRFWTESIRPVHSDVTGLCQLHMLQGYSYQLLLLHGSEWNASLFTRVFCKLATQTTVCKERQ
jgi:hypothetical protein